MVKFAADSQPKTFDPISAKTLGSIAGPVQPASPPAPPDAEPAPEPKAEVPKPGPTRAKQPPAKRPGPRKLVPQSGPGERLSRAVKCLFTPSEELELRNLVARLGSAAGTSLTASHLMRPYFDLLLHCEEELAQELARANIARPHNDKTALAYFERQLAEAIHSALRKAAPLRLERSNAED